MAKIKVGLIGSGFVAELHMYAYQRVYGVDAEVAAVVSRGDHVEAFAKKHRIAQTYRDYRELLADPAIGVVDICTPPALHAEMSKPVSTSSARSRFPAISASPAIRHQSASMCRKRSCMSAS
jgi:predicted dehydrogenase